MNRNQRTQKIRHLALMGMLFALAMAFSFFESIVVVPGLPPGIKLGLSNLVTMYCLFFLGPRSAYGLAILKSGFVFFTRGAVAGFLSLCGGFLSVSVMTLAAKGKEHRFSYTALSILGAVSHNVGQLMGARLILNQFLFYYIPVLLAAGVVVGVLTGITFGYLSPYLKQIDC